MGHVVFVKNIHRAHVGDKRMGKLTEKMKAQHVQRWLTLESWCQINLNI
jgi:hypothetical protein